MAEPALAAPLRAADFRTDQEVRWCPGCGDYAILAAMQSFLPTLGVPRERLVFISGIGCAARFPYYVETYGLHGIHGRAPAIATGLAVSRPDLQVFVVSGDGDALSIGGNHLVHALRRNVDLTILLFNNRVYGLTKGQYSPTSELGTVTKSSPSGTVDHPIDPVSLALGAEATFVARSLDSDRAHLTAMLAAAAAHRGTALIEILQNCPIFNDGAFDGLKRPESAETSTLRMVAGEPLRFGPDGRFGVRVGDGGLEVTDGDDPRVLTHQPELADPTRAFGLARLAKAGGPVPLGVFRAVRHPTYQELLAEHPGTGSADLGTLLAGGSTWTVGDDVPPNGASAHPGSGNRGSANGVSGHGRSASPRRANGASGAATGDADHAAAGGYEPEE